MIGAYEGVMIPQFSNRRSELDTVPSETAWKLIDTLFQQTISLFISAAVFMAIGLIGFVGTGSRWYLAGLAFAAYMYVLRRAQARAYARARDSATAAVWVRRSLIGAWLTAAGWGAWSTVVLFEPDKTLVIMVIGAQAACIMGAVVRNCAVRAIATGQAFLTLTPLAVCCLFSGSIYLNIYTGFVAVHILAAVVLAGFLNRLTVQLLQQGGEKSELVASLELAKQELEIINDHLRTLVATDALTGVANRRAFDLASAREWRRCAREQVPMSLLLLDVDQFKAFNDFYGHQAGDDCLREIAAATASALCRSGDLLARYGGEEFAIILPQTSLDGAILIAEQVLTAITARGLVHDATDIGYVTASIGAALHDADSGGAGGAADSLGRRRAIRCEARRTEPGACSGIQRRDADAPGLGRDGRVGIRGQQPPQGWSIVSVVRAAPHAVKKFRPVIKYPLTKIS
jgi:diguanylate cyclase (GGDEF)-like protein